MIIMLNNTDNYTEVSIHDVKVEDIDAKIPGLKWEALSNCLTAKIELNGITIKFFT